MGRNSLSWAITLADLSIILFMITAADLSNAENARREVPGPSAMIATGEPVAVYRPDGAGIPLHDWLAQQPIDERQLATVLVRRPANEMEGAMNAGLRLVREAKSTGRSARLIVEDGTSPEIVVMLTYDSDPRAMARNLLEQPPGNSPEENR